MEPILEELDFELVDVEYLSEHGRWVLRIYIDKPGGVTLDDCARVSADVGRLIDVRDFIEHEYVLEVSSPGLNRPLKKERDFMRVVGKKVKIRTFNTVNGRRNFTGFLREFQDGVLYLDTDESRVPLPFKNVEKANLVYEFEKS